MPRYIQPPESGGSRYAAQQRQEIVEFVLAWDAKHESDGRKEAQKRFGPTPQTIDNWVRRGLVEGVSWSTWHERQRGNRTKSKGRRYTPSEKAEVLELVQKVNAKKGLGGIKAASEKFGITPLVIGIWMKKAGVPSRSSGLSGRVSADTFERLAELHGKILATEETLAELKKEYAILKRKL